jgi:hypothetical protein
VAPKLAGPAEREYGQEELLRAAAALVRELAGPDGALLVFEDLHWADAESAALFGRLAVTADLPLLLVGTFRPEAVARRHPLVELLADLERQRLVTTVALERLGRAGVGELLAAIYGDRCPSRWPRPCTGAPEATRSSWRSWWSPPAGPGRPGWPPFPSPGA